MKIHASAAVAGIGILGVSVLAAAVFLSPCAPAPTAVPVPATTAGRADGATEPRSPELPPAREERAPEHAGGRLPHAEPDATTPHPAPEGDAAANATGTRSAARFVYVLVGCSDALEAFLDGPEARAMEPADVARVARTIGAVQDRKWPVFLRPGEAAWIAERVRLRDELAAAGPPGDASVLDEQLERDLLRFLGPPRVLDALSDADIVWMLHGGLPGFRVDDVDLRLFVQQFAPYGAQAQARLDALDLDTLAVEVLDAR